MELSGRIRACGANGLAHASDSIIVARSPEADAQIADRYEKATTGIPETLAAIKQAAERQPAS